MSTYSAEKSSIQYVGIKPLTPKFAVLHSKDRFYQAHIIKRTVKELSNDALWACGVADFSIASQLTTNHLILISGAKYTPSSPNNSLFHI